MEGCWVHIYTSPFSGHHHHRNWKVYQQVGVPIATSIYLLALSGALYATMRQYSSTRATFSLSPTQQCHNSNSHNSIQLCTIQSISSNSIQTSATLYNSTWLMQLRQLIATRTSCRSKLYSVSSTLRPQVSLFLHNATILRKTASEMHVAPRIFSMAEVVV